MKIFLKETTIKLSSSPCCDRLFSCGKHKFGDKRHSFLNSSVENQIMLNHNAKFYKKGVKRNTCYISIYKNLDYLGQKLVFSALTFWVEFSALVHVH